MRRSKDNIEIADEIEDGSDQKRKHGFEHRMAPWTRIGRPGNRRDRLGLDLLSFRCLRPKKGVAERLGKKRNKSEKWRKQ